MLSPSLAAHLCDAEVEDPVELWQLGRGKGHQCGHSADGRKVALLSRSAPHPITMDLHAACPGSRLRYRSQDGWRVSYSISRVSRVGGGLYPVSHTLKGPCSALR